jgi:hypothetical protein
MWYLRRMHKREWFFLWLAIGAFGCSTGSLTPGATLLLGLNQYQGELQRIGNAPERWPERQKAANALKFVIITTVGSSTEFNRLIDLDMRTREFLITIREGSVRTDRLQEMRNELIKMDEEVAALKPVVRLQVGTVPSWGEGQQRVESAATSGLLALAVDNFSSAGGRGLGAPSTNVDQYLITDLGSFSTARAPDGQTFRCSLFGVVEDGAGMRCEPVR